MLTDTIWKICTAKPGRVKKGVQSALQRDTE